MSKKKEKTEWFSGLDVSAFIVLIIILAAGLWGLIELILFIFF